jgi:hypothetical protein
VHLVKDTFGLNDKGNCSPDMDMVAGWIATTMQVEVATVRPRISKRVCFNPITMYTILANIAKTRLMSATYSTEMPLEHAFVYAKNINTIIKPLGMAGCPLENYVLGMVGQTIASTWSLKTVRLEQLHGNGVIKTLDQFWSFANTITTKVR